MLRLTTKICIRSRPTKHVHLSHSFLSFSTENLTLVHCDDTHVIEIMLLTNITGKVKYGVSK